jgi:hypothetical protein
MDNSRGTPFLTEHDRRRFAVDQFYTTIQKWDMSNMPIGREYTYPASPMVFIGSKSSLQKIMHDLMYHLVDVPRGKVFTTNENGPVYEGIVPEQHIHFINDIRPPTNGSDTASEIIKQLMIRQGDIVRGYQKEKEKSKSAGVNQSITTDPRTFLIIDGLWNQWEKDRLLRMIMMNGKFWKLLLIITMQFPVLMPPALCTNNDYVFVDTNLHEIWYDQLLKNYIYNIYLNTKQELREAMTYYRSKGYSWICITNKPSINNLYWYNSESQRDR